MDGLTTSPFCAFCVAVVYEINRMVGEEVMRLLDVSGARAFEATGDVSLIWVFLLGGATAIMRRKLKVIHDMGFLMKLGNLFHPAPRS